MRTRRCKMCETSFTVSRDWKIFCSQKCRVRWNKDNAEHCLYCGAYAVDRQRHHVEPCYWRGYRSFQEVEYVYTCPKCNNAIGTQRFSEILDTVDFLIAYYRSKVKPRPEWDEDEIKELGHALRRRVKKMLAQERQYTDRIAYLEASRVFLKADLADFR